MCLLINRSKTRWLFESKKTFSSPTEDVILRKFVEKNKEKNYINFKKEID